MIPYKIFPGVLLIIPLISPIFSKFIVDRSRFTRQNEELNVAQIESGFNSAEGSGVEDPVAWLRENAVKVGNSSDLDLKVILTSLRKMDRQESSKFPKIRIYNYDFGDGNVKEVLLYSDPDLEKQWIVNIEELDMRQNLIVFPLGDLGFGFRRENTFVVLRKSKAKASDPFHYMHLVYLIKSKVKPKSGNEEKEPEVEWDNIKPQDIVPIPISFQEEQDDHATHCTPRKCGLQEAIFGTCPIVQLGCSVLKRLPITGHDKERMDALIREKQPFIYELAETLTIHKEYLKKADGIGGNSGNDKEGENADEDDGDEEFFEDKRADNTQNHRRSLKHRSKRGGSIEVHSAISDPDKSHHSVKRDQVDESAFGLASDFINQKNTHKSESVQSGNVPVKRGISVSAKLAGSPVPPASEEDSPEESHESAEDDDDKPEVTKDATTKKGKKEKSKKKPEVPQNARTKSRKEEESDEDSEDSEEDVTTKRSKLEKDNKEKPEVSQSATTKRPKQERGNEKPENFQYAITKIQKEEKDNEKPEVARDSTTKGPEPEKGNEKAEVSQDATKSPKIEQKNEKPEVSLDSITKGPKPEKVNEKAEDSQDASTKTPKEENATEKPEVVQDSTIKTQTDKKKPSAEINIINQVSVKLEKIEHSQNSSSSNNKTESKSDKDVPSSLDMLTFDTETASTRAPESEFMKSPPDLKGTPSYLNKNSDSYFVDILDKIRNSPPSKYTIRPWECIGCEKMGTFLSDFDDNILITFVVNNIVADIFKGVADKSNLFSPEGYDRLRAHLGVPYIGYGECDYSVNVLRHPPLSTELDDLINYYSESLGANCHPKLGCESQEIMKKMREMLSSRYHLLEVWPDMSIRVNKSSKLPENTILSTNEFNEFMGALIFSAYTGEYRMRAAHYKDNRYDNPDLTNRHQSHRMKFQSRIILRVIDELNKHYPHHLIKGLRYLLLLLEDKYVALVAESIGIMEYEFTDVHQNRSFYKVTNKNDRLQVIALKDFILNGVASMARSGAGSFPSFITYFNRNFKRISHSFVEYGIQRPLLMKGAHGNGVIQSVGDWELDKVFGKLAQESHVGAKRATKTRQVKVEKEEREQVIRKRFVKITRY